MGSNGIFDAFDGETTDEAPDGDVVSSIEDESREQPQANPFDEAAVNTAPEDAGPETPEDRQNQVPESDGNREMGTDRKTVEEQQPFTPSKESAAAVLNDGPRKLNKQLILSIGVGTLAVFIIGSAFIAPLFKAKKTPSVKKPDTAVLNPVDYSMLVPRKERGKPAVIDEQEDDDEILNTLPPVDPAYQYQPPVEQAPQPVMATGQRVSDRPDTKGDRLQGKSISGIKGITPTQSQYLGANGLPNQPYTQIPAAANPYAQFGMPSKEDYTAQMLSGINLPEPERPERQDELL